MNYYYTTLIQKIIDVTSADASVSQCMLAVIEECSRQMPHPDWASFARIDFEADALGIQHWLAGAFGIPEQHHDPCGLWFGLVNRSDGSNTTADVYVGGSPYFDGSDIDWASDIFPITERNYLNSEVLHQIYARAYRGGTGSLENNAEYPLALAYGAIAAVQSLRGDALLSPRLAAVRGAAAGFDSGDLLFLGSAEHGRFIPTIRAG